MFTDDVVNLVRRVHGMPHTFQYVSRLNWRRTQNPLSSSPSLSFFSFLMQNPNPLPKTLNPKTLIPPPIPLVIGLDPSEHEAKERGAGSRRAEMKPHAKGSPSGNRPIGRDRPPAARWVKEWFVSPSPSLRSHPRSDLISCCLRFVCYDAILQ